MVDSRGAAIAILFTVACARGTTGAGDNGSTGGSEEREARCASAIDTSVNGEFAERLQAISKHERSGVAPLQEDLKAVQATMTRKAALTALCVEDRWASEVVDCFDTAPETWRCPQGLPPAQRDRYHAVAKPSIAAEAVVTYERWTDAMCACQPGDTACAKKVTDEQIKWPTT